MPPSEGGRRRMPPRFTLRGVAISLALVATVVVGGGAMLDRIAVNDDPEADELAEAALLPSLPAIPLDFDGVPLDAYLGDMLPPAERDALLASSLLADSAFTSRVHWWVRYWTGPAREWFPDFLSRMAWLGTSVDSALATHGFPPSLRYLPLIESGYAPGVTSSASAVGLWQLMAPTARGLGLEVTPLLDERRDFERSTDAALRYLGELQNEFDSWFFALAAYNTGPTRVRRLLQREAPGVPRTDSLFWALRDQFSSETRDFVPKLYGAMWVASRPEAYGYEVPERDPIAFDVVRVPDQTTLDVVARAAGVSHEEISRLNHRFVRGITPPDRPVSVRVPEGSGGSFAALYALIPTEERVTFVEHVVSEGETLDGIAIRYGVPTAEIEAANPGLEPRRLTVGATLTVPVAPSAQTGVDDS
ncbi:MAG: transglycosylase SLT domain-containing protein [Gemmatimonadota bacterium]